MESKHKFSVPAKTKSGPPDAPALSLTPGDGEPGHIPPPARPHLRCTFEAHPGWGFELYRNGPRWFATARRGTSLAYDSPPHGSAKDALENARTWVTSFELDLAEGGDR